MRSEDRDRRHAETIAALEVTLGCTDPVEVRALATLVHEDFDIHAGLLLRKFADRLELAARGGALDSEAIRQILRHARQAPMGPRATGLTKLEIIHLCVLALAARGEREEESV